MKGIFYLGIAMLFLSVRTGFCDELSDLKAQLAIEKDRIEQQSKKIEVLESKIEALESQQSELQSAMYTPSQEEGEKRIRTIIYGSVEYRDFAREDTVIDPRDLELIMFTPLTDNFKLTSEIEYERAAEVGGDRGGKVELERGYLDWRLSDLFNFRTGVIFVPLGKLNVYHIDTDIELTDRPIMHRIIIPSSWPDAAVGFWGKSSLFEKGGLSYDVYVINGLKTGITDAGLRAARPKFGEDNNNNKAVVGRVVFSPFGAQEIGLSGYLGKYDADSKKRLQGIAGDWQFSKGDFDLLGEYALWDVDQVSSGTAVPERLWGFYTQLNYHFWFSFLNNTFLGRGFESPRLTGIIQYGEAHIDDDGDAGTGDNRWGRLTFGLNYRPVQTIVFKFEYQLNDASNELNSDIKGSLGNGNGFVSSVAFQF